MYKQHLWLLIAGMSYVYYFFFSFYFNVRWLCIHFLEVQIRYCQAKGYLGNVRHWGWEHHSGSSLKTQAFEHQHIFHCCASTGGSPLSAVLFKSACYFRFRQQFRLPKSLLSFVSGRVLACSVWSDHRSYFKTLVLIQRCFINSYDVQNFEQMMVFSW